jgi:NitT/TauT family transport system substrate-binding protein
MRRRQAVSTLALSSVALLASSLRAGAQGAPEKLRIAGPPTEDSTNLFYAIKTGMFTRGGLDVEMISTSSGTAATAAVISGTYEIAKTSLMALFTAHLRGIPIVIVAPELLHQARSPFALLQVAPDSTLRTGSDLNGKIIGVPALNDLNSLATKAWVDKNGGDWKSLKFVEIPNSAMEAALTQKRVDAAILQTPQLDASLSAGTTKTIGDGWSAIAPSFMAGAYVARGDWAAQHGEAVRRFNRVYAEATSYVNTHHAETVQYVVELTKIEVANAGKIRRSQNGTALDVALVQPFIDAAAKYETISRGFPARELFWNG